MVYDAMARHQGGVLSTSSFREVIGKEVSTPEMASPQPCSVEQWMHVTGRFPTLTEMEEFLIAEALRLSDGNQGVAASRLGLSRQALNKRLSRK